MLLLVLIPAGRKADPCHLEVRVVAAGVPGCREVLLLDSSVS